jgi:hypothetical protein
MYFLIVLQGEVQDQRIGNAEFSWGLFPWYVVQISSSYKDIRNIGLRPILIASLKLSFLSEVLGVRTPTHELGQKQHNHTTLLEHTIDCQYCTYHQLHNPYSQEVEVQTCYNFPSLQMVWSIAWFPDLNVRNFIGAQVKEASGPAIKVIQSSLITSWYHEDYLLQKTI